MSLQDLGSIGEFIGAIAEDESLARLFRVGGESLAKLSEDERVRFGFLFLGAFRVFETLYYQNQQGTGDPALWAAEMGTMVALLGSPGGREWWTSNPLSFTPEFRRFVEREILTKAPHVGAAQQAAAAGRRAVRLREGDR